MWQTKTFKTKEAMQKFIAKNIGKIQYQEVFINNGYAIDWRKLNRVY